MEWDQVYRELEKRNWITLLILSAVGYFFFSPALTFGVIVGGFTVILNFRLFQNTLRKAFLPENNSPGNKPLLMIKGFLRLIAVGVVLYILVVSLWVNPVGLAIGLSTVVISILSFGISNATKIMTREAV